MSTLLNEINVFFTDSNDKILMGTLIQKDNDVYFEYTTEFLLKNIEVSPYKLPLKTGLFKHTADQFSDIFGLFADSIPDGWGLLLQDRYLRQQGVNVSGLRSFDRLLYIGETAIGALSYQPTNIEFTRVNQEVDLYKLGKTSIEIYEGKEKAVLSQLIQIGGSPAGARPKILLTEKEGGKLSSDIINIDKDDKHWLIKFDVSRNFKNFSKVEYLYSILAKKAGLNIPNTKLFQDKNKNLYFGIERFDRKGCNKFHVHSFGSLIESNFRVPSNDYDDLFKVAMDLTKSILELEKIFTLMVFNIYAGNKDDHVKNFSFILDHQDRQWKFAPCYDLTPSSGPGGEHSMTILGKGKHIEDSDLISLGIKHNLSKSFMTESIDKIKNSINSYIEEAKYIGLDAKDILELKNYLRL